MPSPAARKAPIAEGRLVLEEFLPFRLAVLASLTSEALSRIYAERFQLTIPAWRVIVTLGPAGGGAARDVVAHGVEHKSTVSRAVAFLEGRGLLHRRPNPRDRREEHLQLTPEGLAVYHALAPEALRFERELEGTLSADERRLFRRLVAKLEASAREFGDAGEIGG